MVTSSAAASSGVIATVEDASPADAPSAAATAVSGLVASRVTPTKTGSVVRHAAMASARAGRRARPCEWRIGCSTR